MTVMPSQKTTSPEGVAYVDVTSASKLTVCPSAEPVNAVVVGTGATVTVRVLELEPAYAAGLVAAKVAT
jgi:hypothetical protein